MTLSTKLTTDEHNLDLAIGALKTPKISQAQITTLKTAAATLRTDLDADVALRDTALAQVKTALDAANTALAKLHTDLDTANQAVVADTVEITRLNAAIAVANTEIARLNGIIAAQPPVVVPPPPPPPTPIPPTTVTPSPNGTRGTMVIDDLSGLWTVGGSAPDRPGEFYLLRNGVTQGIGKSFLVWGGNIYLETAWPDHWWGVTEGRDVGADPSGAVPTPTPIPTPAPTPPPPVVVPPVVVPPVVIPSSQPGVTILPHPAYPQWAQGMKHVTPTFHPDSGCIYLNNGDYHGIEPGHDQSYQQETWKANLAIVKAQGPNAPGAFELVFPYGGFGGIQPKRPDFCGFPWDASRKCFWFVPGQMANGNSNAPGETNSGTDDPCFKYGMFRFYPDKVGKDRWEYLSADMGPNYQETWFTFRDEVKDQLLRIGYNGGDGTVLDIYDCKTLKWLLPWSGGTKSISLNSVGGPADKYPWNGAVRINKEYIAQDVEGRKVYAIDAVNKRVLCINYDSYTIGDCGEAPGLAIPFENYTYLVWNSKHKLLEFNNEEDRNIYVADETVRPLVWKIGAKEVWCRMGVYDPLNDLSWWAGGLGEIGGNPNMVLFEAAKSVVFL